jgi:hypothetical protein
VYTASVTPRGAREHQDALDQGLAPLATSCRPSGADGRGPGGTTESLRGRSVIQSSLRDSMHLRASSPSDESLGYSQSSRRDEPSERLACIAESSDCRLACGRGTKFEKLTFCEAARRSRQWLRREWRSLHQSPVVQRGQASKRAACSCRHYTRRRFPVANGQ